ncbi:phage portal protein [Rhizobium panacihumi]|uniref:phage portal protein n=1 Tax=Rhizobium panacihumi TaxID=2008450 RepID=UPI003D78E781
MMFGINLPWRNASAGRPEARSNLENPTVSISDDMIVSVIGLGGTSASGEPVTIESALGVPPFWGAVNFLSGTLAALPLHLYERSGKGRKKSSRPLADLLRSNVSEDCTSFEWRKHAFEQVFTGGRSYTAIVRSRDGDVIELVALDPSKTKVKRINGRKRYEYRAGGKVTFYDAADVIDIPFMLKADGVGHRSPVDSNKDTIGLAQAVTKYGSKFFQNGGVPPFTITGPYKTPGGAARSADDMTAAVVAAAAKRSLALAVPAGHEIKPLGADPEKTQLIEVKRFIIEEIARIFSLPPVFLQDLSRGTFSNTEQQDLQLVKHTLTRWAVQFEQELNLKLFGRDNKKFFVKLNLDGLLRGDFKTRMEGYARAVQSGQMTPDEAREMEDRPPIGGAASKLHMQGAMLPIDKLGQKPAIGHNGGPPLDDADDGDQSTKKDDDNGD